MYKGIVHLDIFNDIYQKFKYEVSYNGDIVDYQTFMRLSTDFPSITDWMIGRAALTNPFLQESIITGNSPIVNNKERIKNFHEDLLESYKISLFGERHVMDKMKEIWGFMSSSFTNGDKFYKKICKVKTLNDYNTVINNLFKDEDWKS